MQVGPVAKPFEVLKREVDGLLQVECAGIARLNDKVRSRGQMVSQDRENAERFESWLDTFVGRHSSATLIIHRPDISETSQMVARSWIVSSVGTQVRSELIPPAGLEKDIRSRMNEDDEEDLTELPEPIVGHSKSYA